jgi:hypothetical protein
MTTTKPDTTLFASVRELIKEQDELEKALPLEESKFGRWPTRRRRRASTLPKFVSPQRTATGTNGTSGTGFKRRI